VRKWLRRGEIDISWEQSMAFELRGRGKTEQYDTASEAETRARTIILEDADASVEIIDLSTGRPYAPAASQKDRETLARKV
jgi:hypothetical protein